MSQNEWNETLKQMEINQKNCEEACSVFDLWLKISEPFNNDNFFKLANEFSVPSNHVAIGTENGMLLLKGLTNKKLL